MSNASVVCRGANCTLDIPPAFAGPSPFQSLSLQTAGPNPNEVVKPLLNSSILNL